MKILNVIEEIQIICYSDKELCEFGLLTYYKDNNQRETLMIMRGCKTVKSSISMRVYTAQELKIIVLRQYS